MSVSVPPEPIRTLALASPVKVSSPVRVPTKFSKLVALPRDPILIVTELSNERPLISLRLKIVPKFKVSLPSPPSIDESLDKSAVLTHATSLPDPRSMVSLPSLAYTWSLPA